MKEHSLDLKGTTMETLWPQRNRAVNLLASFSLFTGMRVGTTRNVSISPRGKDMCHLMRYVLSLICGSRNPFRACLNPWENTEDLGAPFPPPYRIKKQEYNTTQQV